MYTTTNQFGVKYYYSDESKSILHREDGPAIIHPNGAKCWYINGFIHRSDGPAYIDPGVSQEWFYQNKWHRLDGPAVEYENGKKLWFINGVEIFVNSQKEFEDSLEYRQWKLKVFS